MDKRILFFPLKVLLSFLIFTEVFFFIGPLEYTIPSRLKVFLFFIIVNSFFYIGYRKGVRKYNYTFFDKPLMCPNKLLKFCIGLSLFLIPIRISALWGVSPFSPIAIFRHIIKSVSEPGTVYSDKLDLISGLTAYINIISSPIIYISLSLIIFWWSKLHGVWKFLSFFIIIWEFFLPLGQGVRKGIVDISLMLFFLIIAQKPVILLELRKYKLYILLGGVFIASFLYYFIYSNLARYGLDDAAILVEQSTMYKIKDFYWNMFNPVSLAVICSIESYLCQGYYALANALCFDFTFSYGVGSSWFGVNMMNRFGIDILSYTYVGKLEQIGIDPSINWHSIYTWLASDYTFYGVPIFMYFVGNFLSVTWLDTLSKRNKYAPALFSLFVIMVFYSFANNQVFSLSFIAFFFIFSLWAYTRFNRVH